MTHRDRILAAIRGDPTDRIPWAPRMDLWCIALRERGSLPPEFQGMNTREIADVLDVACHAVRADYTLTRSQNDLVLRGLGIDNHPDYPFRVELRDLEVEFQADAENWRTLIHTPVGKVTTHLQQTREMTRNGISLPFVLDYAIQSEKDFESIACVFDHLEVVTTPKAYDQFHERIGDRGIAVASGPVAASPIHLILHELSAMDRFFYLYHDSLEAMHALGKRMEPFFDACLDAILACNAEVVFWGANYDQNLTWPPFFESEIAPWLRRVGESVHESGKLLLTHTDGENHDLLPYYPDCGFDVAESVCPAPMTRCSLAEIRAGMKTTVWGGIPSVALLESSMDNAAFNAYLDELFDSLGGGDHLILGVSDNVPPDAKLERLQRIGDAVDAFGAVRTA